MARPTKFKPEFAEQAQKLCRLGATDIDLADFFKVSDRTIYRWQTEHPEFCQALKVGKEAADDRIERSLYHKAAGYTFESVKIFMPSGSDKPVYAPYREHVPPDTTAAIFWLKNRRPGDWRDKTEVKHGVDDSLAELLKAIDGKSRGLPDRSVE
jgi:hypothetical protein